MKNNTLKKMPKFGIVLYLSIFILVGLYFVLNGSMPVEVKISNVNNVTTAQIHRKSIMPPFKDVIINMPNVKLAIVTSSRSSKGETTYRVELEAYNGQRYPITYYYSSGYSSKAKLQDKINAAIQSKSDFNYTIRQTFMIFFGLIFMLIPSIMMYVTIKKGPASSTLKRPKTTTSTQPVPTTTTEEEKYKDINDSIIK